jgi:hypothetical protein
MRVAFVVLAPKSQRLKKGDAQLEKPEIYLRPRLREKGSSHSGAQKYKPNYG